MSKKDFDEELFEEEFVEEEYYDDEFDDEEEEEKSRKPWMYAVLIGLLLLLIPVVIKIGLTIGNGMASNKVANVAPTSQVASTEKTSASKAVVVKKSVETTSGKKETVSGKTEKTSAEKSSTEKTSDNKVTTPNADATANDTDNAATPTTPTGGSASGTYTDTPIDSSVALGNESHVVQPGENLYRIAVNAYGSGRYMEAIMQANGLSSTEIQAGQTIVLP